MRSPSKGNLRLGSNVVELLLPQRRPFLMVDFVRAYRPEPVPVMEAGRHISANESYFAGHFPGLYIWPGSLTIEGLGQTAALLMLVHGMRRDVEREGGDPDTVLRALEDLERGFTLHPGYKGDGLSQFLTRLRRHAGQLAVGAAVEMKFRQPVFAGQRLDYRVQWTEDFGDMVRVEAEASVGGAVVASGSLTGARITRPSLPIAEP
jgi:3-hydroxymyristoyl/3-hydroxydecanoyl-(acyl carrier protein) dehydratase